MSILERIKNFLKLTDRNSREKEKCKFNSECGNKNSSNYDPDKCHSNLSSYKDILDSIKTKPKEADKEEQLVPDLDHIEQRVDWSKKIVLIMDDEPLINYFIQDDLRYFESIAKKIAKGINLNSSDKTLLALADANEVGETLRNFTVNDYSIISVTGDYAAFSIQRYIEKIKRVDYAVLDISIGGTLVVNGSRKRLSGIDIAITLKEKVNHKVNLLMYTGNDLGKYSPESIQFEENIKDDLFLYLVNKDSPLNVRRVKLLLFLMNRPFSMINYN